VLEARKLIDYPQGRFPIRYTNDGVSTLLPHVQDARNISFLLEYDALLRAQDGDVAGAWQNCRAIFHTERAVGDEPKLISMLVRIACRATAVHQLERVLAQGQLPEADLKSMQETLIEEEQMPLQVIGMRGERAFVDHLMNAMERGEVSIWQIRPL